MRTFLGLLSLLAAGVVGAAEVAIDWSSNAGPVKPVNGVGQPPMNGGPREFTMFRYLQEAGVPYSRLHDVGGWLGHGLWVDIPNVFPDFEADENDPKNYVFDFTDALVKGLSDHGVEPYFRLGVTIENFAGYGYAPRRTVPPKDFAKWARICEHVIRHYTEGWANGPRLKITYWEIWNEPENHPDPKQNPMWRDDFDAYIRFYGEVATHLKKCFPLLKIGGYGHCGFYAGTGSEPALAANVSPRKEYFVNCSHKFLKTVREKGWPLDFFSYHSYSGPKEALRQVRFADEHLTAYGFTRETCERHINEWLPFVRHENLGSALQASGIAAELIGLQNGPCDVACIYDARCNIGNYSPLFNPLTYEPHKAYYAFMAFNELRKLGTAVRCTSSDADLWATAAKGAPGQAVMLANCSDRPISFKLDHPASWRVRITDAHRTWAECPLPSVLGPETFLIAVRSNAADVVTDPAAPREHLKTILGVGWEFLRVRTEDVWRNRGKFAATGLDGIVLSLDRRTADGKVVPARNVLTEEKWTDAEFARSVGLAKAASSEPGLRESLALAYLIPRTRLAWTNDAAWAKAAANLATLGRAAKAAGLKGIVIDHEDYTKQSQFRRTADDPDYDEACAWARARGRQLFRAFFGEFPEARVLTYYMASEFSSEVVMSSRPDLADRAKGNLWTGFLNGLLDVTPPPARLIEGNESFGYYTDGGMDVFKRLSYESLRGTLPLIEPENRATYATRTSVSFGQYIDPYTQPKGFAYYRGPHGGSRFNHFRRNLLGVSAVADDTVWIYGERGTFIDWDVDLGLKQGTWESQLPGFADLVRLAKGDTAYLHRRIAEGRMTNVVANGGCDRLEGALPSGFSTHTDAKDPAADLFAFDAQDGASKAGCLRLNGNGTYLCKAQGLVPGEVIYVRLAAKGRAAKPCIGWSQSGRWRWDLGSPHLTAADAAADLDGWHTMDARLVVPDGADAATLLMEPARQPKPVYPIRFDDIGIFR